VKDSGREKERERGADDGGMERKEENGGIGRKKPRADDG
jgi:hypothetical protein